MKWDSGLSPSVLMSLHRHKQASTKMHKAALAALCRKMLGMAHSLPKIHFSDESKIVLGGDQKWIWYREGEDNSTVSKSSVKFPPSITELTVIRIDFKSELMLVEESIDNDRYLQNLDHLGCIDVLNEKHGMFGEVLQQDGALAHTSQAVFDWLEENVEIIVN
jgi:hypothetical protein